MGVVTAEATVVTVGVLQQYDKDRVEDVEETTSTVNPVEIKVLVTEGESIAEVGTISQTLGDELSLPT